VPGKIESQINNVKQTTTGVGVLLASLLLATLAPAQVSVELTEVAEDVYAIRRNYVGSNAAAIVTDKGIVIVDSHASPAAARDTLRSLRQITDKPVRYVINTHWHTDHMAGNQAYFDSYGPNVEFISHHSAREDMQTLAREQMPVTVKFLAQDVKRAEHRLGAEQNGPGQTLTESEREQLEIFVEDQSSTLEKMRAMQFILPTMTLARSLVLHISERPIHILYFGKGHTRGDVVVYLPTEKVVVTGDLLTTPQLYVGGSSYPAQWAISLKALARLDFEHIIPGHGDVYHGKEYLTLITAMFDSIVEQVREAVNQGHKFKDVQQQVTLSGLRRSLVEGDPEREKMFDRAANFLEDAVGRAYLEARGRLQSRTEP
jgi:glyoxylase-like metal-dependent hydrolase (beta-lactamase superfamily II)